VCGLIVATLISACGNGSVDPSPTATDTDPTPQRTVKPGQRGPRIVGTATLEGAIESKAKIEILYPFADEDLNSCGKIAEGTRDSYVIPLPSSAGDKSLLWNAAIRPYAGPGKFDEADLSLFAVEVRGDATDEAGAKYERTDDTTASITVAEDNSGSITFENLRGPDDKKLSGSAEWTCS
jgi:hypothetical protein